MHRRVLLPILLLPLVPLAACDDGTGPELEEFSATLNGDAEVPANASAATGTAEFELNADQTVTYTIDVSNLRNVFAAHIHGPANASANAPVLVNLLPDQAQNAPIPLADGRLVSGSFGAAQIANPAVSMDSLQVLMGSGNVYVNLHTNDGMLPPNTGPGDMQAGEIRGQIRGR